MPILQGDIDFRLSGGATNTSAALSLGGAKSSEELVDLITGNLFANILGAESAAGSVKYRCYYVHNNHPTLTLQSAKVFINTDTPNPDTDVEIGVGTSGINGIEQTVVDEDTSPTGITWETVAGEINALNIGDIPPGEHMAIWWRRTVIAGSVAYDDDGASVEVKGDTAA